MSTHLSFNDLSDRIKTSYPAGRPWKGYIFRFVEPKYAKTHKLISGFGSYKNGGRWNAPGSFRAVYGSLTGGTAILESENWARYYNIPVYALYPKVMVSLDVSLQNVFDLTSVSNRKLIGFSKEKLLECDWRKENEKGREALPQTIGRAIFTVGYEGILTYSSPDPTGVNMVCFPKKFGVGSYIKCVNSEKL